MEEDIVMACEREHVLLVNALGTALEENHRLKHEIDLLQAQLRRHPSGELQIRQVRRQLAAPAHPNPNDDRPPAPH